MVGGAIVRYMDMHIVQDGWRETFSIDIIGLLGKARGKPERAGISCSPICRCPCSEQRSTTRRFPYHPPPHTIVSVLQGGSDRHTAGIGEQCAVVAISFSAIILILSKLFILYFRQRLWRNLLGDVAYVHKSWYFIVT